MRQYISGTGLSVCLSVCLSVDEGAEVIYKSLVVHLCVSATRATRRH